MIDMIALIAIVSGKQAKLLDFFLTEIWKEISEGSRWQGQAMKGTSRRSSS